MNGLDILNLPVPVKKCTACPLHESAMHNCIDGRGPAHAKVMLVAQGPGGQEDMRGEVLIGRSGQLLDQMLRDAGYDPQEVFKTNATRCRAPGDRAPTSPEIDACRDHLRREILQVRPDVIVALGDSALRALCKTSGIQSRRGKSFPLHGYFEYDCPVFPTYHPAFVLRTPHAQNIVTADLRRVRDRTVEQEPVPWERYGIGTLIVEHTKVIGIDIEAGHTYDEKKKKYLYTDAPVQAAAATESGAVVACGEKDMYAMLMPCAFMAQTIVTHNGWEYDIPKIREHVGVPIPWGRDTLVLAYLDDETQPLGLEALCVKYLGVRGWKEDSHADMGTDAFAEYNARDAWLTVRLHSVLEQRLGARINLADQIIGPARVALLACTQRGIYIDGAAVAAAKTDCETRLDAALTTLRGLVANQKFNPNSGAQVAAVLESQGITLPKTRTGKAATGRNVLQKLLDDEGEIPDELQDETNGFMRALLSYRKAKKTLSTYIKPYEAAAASESGRIYPAYTCYKTSTGRTSAHDPNAQNLDRKYQHFMSAPPGFVWLVPDFAGIEFRLAAWAANERTIIERYQANPNWDPHLFFAFRLYDAPLSEAERAQAENASKAFRAAYPEWEPRRTDVAKSANFSQLFVGGPGTLIEYGLKQDPPVVLSWAQAQRIHRAWHATFPAFRPFYQETWDFVKANGYIETVTGRRRHFGNVKLLNEKGRVDVLREAVNMRVQPLATADLSLLALVALHEAGFAVNFFGHDAVGIEIPEQEWYANHPNIEREIHRCMVEKPLAVLRDSFGVHIDIPIEIEIKVRESRKENEDEKTA